MTPDAWRRHARLLEAVARPRSGASVTAIALDLGYQSVSAFSQAFRASFGASPGRARLCPLRATNRPICASPTSAL
ncbi:MAG: AraC family transcriptional regulator [Alphaproteobacteria bacterium]|nr:AraC family transcriptional regulator [Alphaproteobacteria bacterium]